MKLDCEIIRDLLPLYADDACSGKSRELVKEHLLDCPECREMLLRLRETELETNLRDEKKTVIQYGAKKFRRRSAAVGSVVSSLFMIPILICLIVNLTVGSGLGWFFIVLASLAVAASLILVPLTVPEDKAFWTLCAFCASLMALLGVVCLYTRGTWFWIASSAALFGLSVVFLPFAIRARPLQKLIGNGRRWVVVLGVDGILFINMMSMIASHGRLTPATIVFTLVVLGGIGLVINEILRKRGTNK